MNGFVITKIFTIVLFILSFISVRILPAQEGCLENGCHAKLMAQSRMHVPASEGCDGCHEQNSMIHPGAPGEEFTLLDSVPSICFSCHEDFSGIKNVHLPVEQGKCLDCHNPHAAENSKLLHKSIPDICFDCHGPSKNATIAERTDIREKIMQKEYVHAPAAGAECISCHSAHASEYVFLLKAAYPEGNYADGQSATYEICFSCHDPALIDVADDPSASGFRAGERNLHALHLQQRMGRSCRTCHDVHGSDHPHLIAESIRFNQWKSPFYFEIHTEGGSCLCACHQSMTYLR